MIHNIMLMRMVIWQDVMPPSSLRKQKTSVNLLQIEMDRLMAKVNAVIWNQDALMTFKKSPKNKGTKNNASKSARQMIEVSQKWGFRLLGSLFLFFFLMDCEALVLSVHCLIVHRLQEVVDSFHGVEGFDGHFNEDGNPVGHGTVPEAGKF